MTTQPKITSHSDIVEVDPGTTIVNGKFTRIRFTFPRLPKVNPNSRTHWRGIAKAKKQDMELAELQARAAMGRRNAPKWPKASMAVTWYAKSRVRPDPGNAIARFKGIEDAIQNVGIVTNDRDLYPSVVFDISPKSPRLVITIEPVEAPI